VFAARDREEAVISSEIQRHAPGFVERQHARQAGRLQVSPAVEGAEPLGPVASSTA
jgi:hypothetical protein